MSFQIWSALVFWVTEHKFRGCRISRGNGRFTLKYTEKKNSDCGRRIFFLTLANVLKRKENFWKMSFTHLKCEHCGIVGLKKKIFLSGFLWVYAICKHLKEKRNSGYHNQNSSSGNRIFFQCILINGVFLICVLCFWKLKDVAPIFRWKYHKICDLWSKKLLVD